MGLLDGKKVLVTGVLTDASIAFHVARIAQEEGADVVLTSFGRQMKITTAIARRLPKPAPLVELDVTNDDDLAALPERVSEHADRLGADGVRVNLVAAGPIRTTAAKSIPGFEAFESVWPDKAPLGWDITNPEPTARTCAALLSDWFPATTGEIVHVDGGFHAMG